MKTLLVEYNAINYDRNLIQEAYDMSKPLVLKGVVLQRADVENQNKRKYPFETLMREAKAYKEHFVMERRAMGELDHPESPVVNLKNVCSNITDIWFEGKDVMGNIEILTTPSGNIVRELIKNNIRLGVSSRGMGSLKTVAEGVGEVQDDFALICFDIVSNPSTHGAFINENTDGSITASPYTHLETLIQNFLSEVK